MLILVVMYLIILTIYVGYVALKHRVSAGVLLRKLWPATMVGLTTASSVAALSRFHEDSRRLGVAEECTDLSYSLNLSFNNGPIIMLYIVVCYHLAEAFHTPVSLAWFVTALVISIVIGYSTPPISGSVVICMGMMIARLGLPRETLGIAGTMALILEFLSTGARVACVHMETVLQADHMKMLDTDTLRTPQ